MHWIWFAVAGAIVGTLGRVAYPGRDPAGWLPAILVGIVAMLVAAAISSGWVAFVAGVAAAASLALPAGRFAMRPRAVRGRAGTFGVRSGPSPHRARCTCRR